MNAMAACCFPADPAPDVVAAIRREFALYLLMPRQGCPACMAPPQPDSCYGAKRVRRTSLWLTPSSCPRFSFGPAALILGMVATRVTYTLHAGCLPST